MVDYVFGREIVWKFIIWLRREVLRVIVKFFGIIVIIEFDFYIVWEM